MEMKRILILLVAVVALTSSCKKDDSDGVATVEVSLKYSENRTDFADEGASVFLFADNGDVYEDSWAQWYSGGMMIKGTLTVVLPVFKGVADVNGLVTISGVPTGKYILVASSKKRYVFSRKNIQIKSGVNREAKRFGSIEFHHEGEKW